MENPTKTPVDKPNDNPTSLPKDNSTKTTNDNSKNIFKYNNGIEDIYEDPFDVEFRIQEAQDLEDMALIDKWISGVKDETTGELLADQNDSAWKLYRKACARLVPIIRKGFKLAPFNTKTGEGLTAEQVLDLYADFLLWRNDVKKNTE